MEQLFETFGVNWKLLYIQGINFALLLTGLTYLLYRPLMRIIDERRDKIAEGVRTADAAAQIQRVGHDFQVTERFWL